MSLRHIRLPGVSKLTQSLRRGNSGELTPTTTRNNKTSNSRNQSKNTQHIPENRGTVVGDGESKKSGNIHTCGNQSDDSDDSWVDINHEEIQNSLQKENLLLEDQVIRLCRELAATENTPNESTQTLETHQSGCEAKCMRGNTDSMLRHLKIQIEAYQLENVHLVQEKVQNCKTIQDLHSEVCKLRGENGELRKQARGRDANIQDLSIRLSKEMGTKLTTSETSLEKTNIRNGPMNVADQYLLFTSRELIDAKICHDETDSETAGTEGKNCTEVDKMKILCDILMVAETICRKLYTKFTTKVISELRSPFLPRTDHVDSASETNSDEPDENANDLILKSAIADYLRNKADNVETTMLCKAISAGMESLYRNQHSKQPHLLLWPDIPPNHPNFRKFLGRAAEITWKMALQRPSMAFSVSGVGQSWSETQQDLHWESDNPQEEGSKVSCYVYLGLLHGDTIMVKGKVLVKKTSPIEDNTSQMENSTTAGPMAAEFEEQ